MSSIYSGQLLRTYVRDFSLQRQEKFNVNRYNQDIVGSAAQGRREKELREGLEYHQARMADMQTKLNEMTEKLNNLYRRFMENSTAFRKVTQEPLYHGTSKNLNNLPDVTNASGLPPVYPAGVNGILPYADPGRIRNYTYNPYFGSKAIDESDQTVIRTSWAEPNTVLENAYFENGAFWSAISYLWGWDLDRINATYVTTDNLVDKQINVTALQPNKPQYPPLRPGDRFPINASSAPGGSPSNYPSINLGGIRPGGADYNHATNSLHTGTSGQPITFSADIISGNGAPGNPIQVNNATGFNIGDVITVVKNDASNGTATITNIDTSGIPHLIYTNSPAGSNNSSGTISKTTVAPDGLAHVNVVGENSINWGWEFDDLPLALEVTSVSLQPDGNTVPTGFKMVYDIPTTHPFYEHLRHLNGTEPQIIDAPKAIEKIRIENEGFKYTGSIYFPGSNVVPFQVGPLFQPSRGKPLTVAQVNENEYSAPGVFNPGGIDPNNPPAPIASLVLDTCVAGITIDANTIISFNHRFRTQQNAGIFGSPGNDSGPGVPVRFGFSGREWDSAGGEYTANSGTWINGATMNLPYETITDARGDTLILLGRAAVPNTSQRDYLMYGPTVYEELWARVRAEGTDSNQVRVDFFFSGDINRLEVEISDLQIISYLTTDSGPNADWSTGTGLYNSGTDRTNPSVNPMIMVGDPTYTSTDSPQDVVSKYYPNVYQFTQFNDQYNNSYAGTSNRNDIVRSPWEFGLLNIGEGSGLSGELFIDLNGRRLNLSTINANPALLKPEYLSDLVRYWDGSLAAPSNTGFDFLMDGLNQVSGVSNAYSFVLPVHPSDECGPDAAMNILATNTGTGHPFDPFNPSGGGGIAVDSVAGFTVGQSVTVDGAGPFTIVALVNSPASDGGDFFTPSFGDDDVWPTDTGPNYTFTYNPIFPFDYTPEEMARTGTAGVDGDGNPTQAIPPWPMGYDATTGVAAPINTFAGPFTLNEPDPADLPLTVPGPGIYANYADLVTQHGPDPGDLPPGTNSSSPFFWIGYDAEYIPPQPARMEVFLNAPAGTPTSGQIRPIILIPPPAHVAQYADSDPMLAFDYRHLLLSGPIDRGDTPFDPADIPSTIYAAGLPFGVPTDALRLDPGRTANPTGGAYTWSFNDFYNFGDYTGPTLINNPDKFITGTENDNVSSANIAQTGTGAGSTIDRVLGSDIPGGDSDMRYTIAIPTLDMNVLRKENNLLFNVGSIASRDYGIEIVDPYMEFRVVQEYLTVPRYRVDAGGNIYDRFGEGFYDTRYGMAADGTIIDNSANAEAIRNRAQEAVAALYTKYGASAGEMINGQVSNFNGNYDPANWSAYDLTAWTGAVSEEDFIDFILSHDRFSMLGDDYNLFDYVPDLREIIGLLENPDGQIPTQGELYVGSLPTNFYYYREPLDISGAGPTGGGFNNDRMPTLNFNGRNDNPNGLYNAANTVIVHNPLMPSWTGVTIGFTEQNARLSNQMRTTSFATWEGFSGLGEPPMPSRSPLTDPNSMPPGAHRSINVSNPVNAVGLPNGQVATMNINNPAAPPDSTLFLDMGSAVNEGGHLIVYEMVNGQSLPHAIPLPLKDLTMFPDPDPTSFTFSAYGPGTMTRSGSSYIANFATQILDGLDGSFDGNWTNANAVSLLTAAGAEVSTSNPPSSWTSGLILHVDDANAFDVEAPRNRVYLGADESIEYRVVAKNSTNKPETLYLVPVAPGAVPDYYRPDAARPTLQRIPTDLAVRQIMGEYTITVTDENGTPNANGSAVRLQYNDRDTALPGLIDAIVLSPEMDRAGRLNPGAEVFDNPMGYVQSDAQVNLRLVSQDTDGNPVVRKLRSISVEIESGEQLIPNKITQTYSTDGPFNLNGEWPIALYEKDRQLNPATTPDLGVFVGLSQGITDGSEARNNPPLITLTSTAGFGLGEEVTVNGEKRTIAGIGPSAGPPALLANQIMLSAPLVKAPRYGDVVSLGSPMGDRELIMYLNKSYAMSANAPVRITLEYDEYEITGYPPIVDLTTPARTLTENIGFGDANPSASMVVSPANTGTGAVGNLLTVVNATGFAPGDVINYGGQTATIISIAGNNLRLSDPIGIWDKDTASYIAPTQGTIYRTDYENYLVVGEGRKGGSFDNHFTNELKRIVDNPEYQDLMRYDLLKNVFITATINTPFNDIISSKIMLTWDRRKKYVEIEQAAFTAYFKSGG